MHPYIPYCLEDIAAAHHLEIDVLEYLPMTFEEEMEEIENWVAGEEPLHTFGYYCGLSAEQFPPPEQLSDDDMKLVCDAFNKMMFSYNHGIDLPETLPIAFAYKIIVDSLNMKTNIPKSGLMHFDFCTGYAPDCIFKEYCPCIKIWNDASL